MTFIVPFKRMSPDIDTEQGSYENPFVPYSAIDYLSRTPPLTQPWDLRGRHQYRTQPRQLGPGVMGLDGIEIADNDGETRYPGASVPYPPMPGVQGFGAYDEYLRSVQGFGQTPAGQTTISTTQLVLLVGLIGLAAYLLGQHMAKKARRNPVACRRGWTGRGRQTRAYVCAQCASRRQRPVQMSGWQAKNRKLASKARRQPRDESGKFI